MLWCTLIQKRAQPVTCLVSTPTVHKHGCFQLSGSVFRLFQDELSLDVSAERPKFGFTVWLYKPTSCLGWLCRSPVSFMCIKKVPSCLIQLAINGNKSNSVHIIFGYNMTFTFVPLQPTATSKFFQGYVGAVTSAVSIAVSVFLFSDTNILCEI